jgi:hypothetical protein
MYRPFDGLDRADRIGGVSVHNGRASAYEKQDTFDGLAMHGRQP